MDVNFVWIFFMNFFFGITLFFFTLYHIKLIGDNTTTIESLEKQERNDVM